MGLYDGFLWELLLLKIIFSMKGGIWEFLWELLLLKITFSMKKW